MLRAPFHGILFLLLLTAGVGISNPAAAAGGHSKLVYYVSAEGSDTNDGRSPDSAWRSITRLESLALQPGDRVLLRRGDTWREQLTASSAGTPEASVRFGAYGEGALPRIAGTAAIAPYRNAVRNFDFAEFRGVIDDGIGDDFLHFTTAGGRVEAVSDTATGDGTAVKLGKDGGAKAHLFAYVYLPADTPVVLRWKARSRIADGAVALRHRLGGSVRYLQPDLANWSTVPCWRVSDLAGGVDEPWRDHSIAFTTDGQSGMYQLYFISGNADDGSTSWLDDVQLRIDWIPYDAHTYRIGTGYLPRRLLIKGDAGWAAAVYRAEAPKESLSRGQWTYDADDGHVYLRWENGNPATAGVDMEINPATAGLDMEISVPESGEQGQCGIYIDRPYVAVDSLAVEGWPDDSPDFNYVGGIAVTDNAHYVSISRCRVDFNYRVGVYARADQGRFTDNRFAYNGGSGLVFYGEARGNHIARNESSYNGFQGVDSDDGEGIGLGRGTADNLIEANRVHHNNLNLNSGNHGGLVLYQSSRNIIRYNRIFANTKSGLVIEGDRNQVYYNLIYENGSAAADTDVSITANLYLRDGSAESTGGNRVINNLCYGGGADVRWMGNLFIKAALKQAEIRNNVFWGFENLNFNDVQIRIDAGTDLSETVFSNNLIGPEGPGFVHCRGQNYATLENYQSVEGQEIDSISLPPQFAAPDRQDFHPLESSPLIDAGIDVGLDEDFDGNRLHGRPDIGALEFIPPNAKPVLILPPDPAVEVEAELAAYVRAYDPDGDAVVCSARLADGTGLDDIGAVFTTLLLGDLNEDGTVNFRDLRIFRRADASRCGEMRYNPKADFTGDGRVDGEDRRVLFAALGNTLENGTVAWLLEWRPSREHAGGEYGVAVTASDAISLPTTQVLTIRVPYPEDAACRPDFNLNGRVDVQDLLTKQQSLRREYHRWLNRCYRSRLPCGDVDADDRVHSKDRMRQYRTVLRRLWNWVYSCWLPAMT